jgi:hypothetical protein
MAQYEQKTDSREFEVANSGQQPATWRGDLAGDSADIAIRLWGVERAERGAPLTWKADSVLIYMIADLVGASHGRITEESSAAMAAHFESSRQALVAAKRIQTSILEFLDCRPGEHFGGAIVIYRPRTADPAGFSIEMAQLALGQAKPGQILLAESVCLRVRDLPGIELATVPAVRGATGNVDTGLTELVWTTAERVARLRESVGDWTEPRRGDSLGVGATLIVDSPFARGGMNDVAPPVESAGDFAAKGSADAWNRTEQAPNTAQRRAASSGEFQERAGSSLAEGLEFEERPLFTRTRILLGVVALVLVGAVIAVLFHPTTVAKRAIPIPPPAAVETTGGAGTGSEVGTSAGTSVGTPTGTSTGAPAEPETKKAEEPVTPPPPVKKTVVVSQKTPPKTTAKNKKDAVEAQAEVDASLSEFGGLTQKDIPRLLDNAKRDAGDGNYEKARREYQAILKLQANNPDAKEGLRKLSIIQGDKDQ